MKDLTTGSVAKHIFFFSLPMLIGNVFQQFYNMTDSFVVGNFVGKDALAAVGAAFPVIFLMVALIMGITMGSTIIIAQYYGAKNMQKLKEAVDTSYIVLLAVSVVLSVIGFLLVKPVLLLLNTPPEILDMAAEYLNIIFAGLIFTFGYNSISGILRGLGDSKTPLFFLIVSTLINVFLDLLFVIAFKWGVAGVAVATVLAQGISFVAGIIYLNATHPVLKFSIKNIVFKKDIFFKSIRIGFPSGIQQMLVGAGMMALIRIVNDYGINALAAYTAASRIDMFAMMPAMNISLAVSAFTGQNIGANRIDRVQQGFKVALLITAGISLVMTLAVTLFGSRFTGLFNSDPEVIRIGGEYLAIVGSFYLMIAVMFTANGVIRGAGDTFITMFFTLAGLWLVRIPLSAVLSFYFGTKGIWWGIPIGFSVGAVISAGYYLGGRWKRKVIIDRTGQIPVPPPADI